MKKYFLTLSAATLIFVTNSCNQKAETIQEKDTTSEMVLPDNETPSQYQGSTGVEEGNNNMVANENIEIKKQDFNGSFSTSKTQTYTFTVLNAQDYTFSLDSENTGVQYIVSKKDGPVVLEASREKQTVNLQPGEYTVVGTMASGNAATADSTTEFTVHIE